MTPPRILAIAPDGASSITLTKSLATDVMVASDGTEVRHSMREVAVRTLTYSITLAGIHDLELLISTWLIDEQPLRFGVPIWCECYVPSDITGAAITTDRTPSTLSPGMRVLLWQSDYKFEEGVIDTIVGSVVTLESPPSGTYAVGAVRLIEVMTAWMDPATIAQGAPQYESLSATFHEELPGIAGSDPDTPDAVVTPEPFSLDIEQVRGETAYVPQSYVWMAVVRDKDGLRIPGAHVDWFTLITDTPDYEWPPTDPNIHASISIDRQFLLVSYHPGAPGTGSTGIRATCGSLVCDVGIVL